MSNLIEITGGADHLVEAVVSSTLGNTTTKEDLLSRARTAIEAGEQSLHKAAEALGLAQEEHFATQREMAEAVGKSASWVNKLLKWRRSGYKNHSPFGPTTIRDRVEHAQQRAPAHSKGETPPRGAAAARRDGRRAEGALQLYRVWRRSRRLFPHLTSTIASASCSDATTVRIWMGS